MISVILDRLSHQMVRFTVNDENKDTDELLLSLIQPESLLNCETGISTLRNVLFRPFTHQTKNFPGYSSSDMFRGYYWSNFHMFRHIHVRCIRNL